MTFEPPHVAPVPPRVVNLHEGCPLCGGSLINPNDPDDLCPNQASDVPEHQTPWHRAEARKAWLTLLLIASLAVVVALWLS